MQTVTLYYDPDDLTKPARSSEFESIQDVIDSVDRVPGEGLKIYVNPISPEIVLEDEVVDAVRIMR